MSAPCKNCSVRVIGCHASCEKYREWRKYFERAAEERNRQRPARQFRDDGKYRGFKDYKMPKQKGGR